MNNAVINFPLPANEPVKAYLAGSPERVALEQELERQSKIVVDIPIIIGGKEKETLTPKKNRRRFCAACFSFGRKGGGWLHALNGKL